jgi:Xaa-Pro aminopeptidase
MITDTVDNDFFPPFSRQEIRQRYSRVRDWMKESGLDCLVLYSAHSLAGNDTGHTNAMYLSNYAPCMQGYVVFPLKDEPNLFISHSNHVANARDLSVIKDVRCVGFNIEKGVGDRLKELGLDKGNIGVVGPASSWFPISIPVEHHDYLTKALPEANFKVVTNEYINLTLVKSEEEIEHLQRGAVMTDIAHEQIFLSTKPGVRHSDLRRIVAEVANACGGHFPFSHVSSTSMTRPAQSYPDFYPTHRQVQTGDVLLTELSLGVGIYFGKIYGSFFVGEPTREYRHMFELAAGVYTSALKELKPGSTGSDVQRLMQPIEKAGYASRGYMVGGWSTYNQPPHIGRVPASGDPHDQKSLDFVFKPGHCVTVGVSILTRDEPDKGLWVGSACTFTRDMLQTLHKYPVSQLRIIPL